MKGHRFTEEVDRLTVGLENIGRGLRRTVLLFAVIANGGRQQDTAATCA